MHLTQVSIHIYKYTYISKSLFYQPLKVSFTSLPLVFDIIFICLSLLSSSLLSALVSFNYNFFFNLTESSVNMKRLLILILFTLIVCNTQATLQFFSSKPGDPETSPSLQLMLRNMGIGLFTDPLFNRFRKRWETIRYR